MPEVVKPALDSSPALGSRPRTFDVTNWGPSDRWSWCEASACCQRIRTPQKERQHRLAGGPGSSPATTARFERHIHLAERFSAQQVPPQSALRTVIVPATQEINLIANVATERLNRYARRLARMAAACATTGCTRAQAIALAFLGQILSLPRRPPLASWNVRPAKLRQSRFLTAGPRTALNVTDLVTAECRRA